MKKILLSLALCIILVLSCSRHSVKEEKKIVANHNLEMAKKQNYFLHARVDSLEYEIEILKKQINYYERMKQKEGKK